MVKKNRIRKPTKQGEIIQYLTSTGKTNAEICKFLRIPKTTVSYYRKRPLELEAKRESKLPKEYLNEIIRLASNKTTSQMSRGCITKMKRKKLLSITKRGKQNFKKNMWTFLLLTIFMTLVVGEYIITKDGASNIEVLDNFIKDRKESKQIEFFDKDNPNVIINEYLDKSLSQLFTGNMT